MLSLWRFPNPLRTYHLKRGTTQEAGSGKVGDKPELSEHNDSEQGASDTRSRASSRSQAATLIDLLDKSDRYQSHFGRKGYLEKAPLAMDQAKLELEQEKFKEDLRLRKKRLGAELRLQKKQQEAELELRRKQQEADLELRRKQQEADLELRESNRKQTWNCLKREKKKTTVSFFFSPHSFL